MAGPFRLIVHPGDSYISIASCCQALLVAPIADSLIKAQVPARAQRPPQFLAAGGDIPPLSNVIETERLEAQSPPRRQAVVAQLGRGGAVVAQDFRGAVSSAKRLANIAEFLR